jgi:hypothetical protein
MTSIGPLARRPALAAWPEELSVLAQRVHRIETLIDLARARRDFAAAAGLQGRLSGATREREAAKQAHLAGEGLGDGSRSGGAARHLGSPG